MTTRLAATTLSMVVACGGLLLGPAGCSGGASKSPATVTVSLDVTSATFTVQTVHAFVATVSGGSPGVSWSVREGSAGGSVDADGNYTAPAATGSFHVVATSAADPAATATAAVTVVAAPAIASFSASPAEILSGQSSTLTAAFANGTGTVDHGVGAATSGVGVPTGPLTASQVYVLTVTNAAGTSVSSGAAVIVDKAVAVGVLPTDVTVEQGSTQGFTALVAGTTDTSVTWSVQEAGGGGVSPSGVYTPPAQGGTYHVVATSTVDPARTASARVTVPPAWQPAQVSSLVGWHIVKVASNAAGHVAILAYVPYTENGGVNRDELDLVHYTAAGGLTGLFQVALGQNAGDNGIENPDLCMDAAGNITVAWGFELSGSPGAFIPYTRRYTAGTQAWGIPIGMDSTSFRSNEIHVACAPSGLTYAAWKRLVVSGGTYQVCVDTFPAGGPNWTAVSTLAPPGPDPGISPVVAASPGGKWVVSGSMGDWVLDVPGLSFFGEFLAGTLRAQSAVARMDALGNGTAVFGVIDGTHPEAWGVYVAELQNAGTLAQSFFALPGSAAFTPLDLVEQDDGVAAVLMKSDREAFRTSLAVATRRGLVWSPIAPLGTVASASASPQVMTGLVLDGSGTAVAVWGAGPSASTFFGSASNGGDWSPARALPKGSAGATLSNLTLVDVGGHPMALWEENGFWTTSLYR
jgi:hypothetical protein